MNLWEDFKEQFNRPNNAVRQLILFNVAVFVILGILLVVGQFTNPKLFAIPYNWLAIPSDFNTFITRPWTILTYSFLHSYGYLLHILFNMLFLYWFGRLIQDFLGDQKVINLYILGGIAGGALYLLTHNLLDYYTQMPASQMVGASAAVYAVMVGAATLMPDHQFHLLFFGPVKIKYLVAILVFISYLGIVGSNAGGNIAHLAGAFIGFIYIKQLQRGNDIGHWIYRISIFIKSLFKPQSQIHVSYKKKESGKTGRTRSTRSNATPSSKAEPSQQEIDAILDKISEKGYESLSKDEKEKLFNAGKR